MSAESYKQNVTTAMILVIFTNFAKKKILQTSLKKIVICTQNISSFVNQSLYALFTSCFVISKYYKSLFKKVIIDFRITNYFFANCIYFSIYKEYHYKFQIGFSKILIAYKYRDVVLCLAHSNSSEGTWIIKKISWALLLEYNLLSTILFIKKGVKVFL